MTQNRQKYLKNMRSAVLRFCGFAMALTVAFFVKPCIVRAAEQTGTFGVNGGLTWKFDSEKKILTISGEDEPNNELDTSKEFYGNLSTKYLDGVVHVVFEDCVIVNKADMLLAGLNEMQDVDFSKGIRFQNVTSAAHMFESTSKLKEVDLGGIDFGSVTNVSFMFKDCGAEKIDLSKADFGKVTNMSQMFRNCFNLQNVQLPKLNPENSMDLSFLFFDCRKLEKIDLAMLGDVKANSALCMFEGCRALKDVDMSRFDFSTYTGAPEESDGDIVLFRNRYRYDKPESYGDTIIGPPTSGIRQDHIKLPAKLGKWNMYLPGKYADESGAVMDKALPKDGGKALTRYYDGLENIDGVWYFYEDNVRQGTEGRGKEIYYGDSGNAYTVGWYWCDAEADGAIAREKKVYLEHSSAGVFAENSDGTGKWVYYGADGQMVKGEFGADGFSEPNFGAIVKGYKRWNMKLRKYDLNGVLVEENPLPEDFQDNGWLHLGDADFWFEEGYGQGCYGRGREIYDPGTDAWYWLDSCNYGAKAVSKEVFMPYIYQNEATFDDADIERLTAQSGDMAKQVAKAIREKSGKWVRYDADGRMYKGWYTVEGDDAKLYPDQAGNTYYYDPKTGLMAKGTVTIDGKSYTFDEETGALMP